MNYGNGSLISINSARNWIQKSIEVDNVIKRIRAKSIFWWRKYATRSEHKFFLDSQLWKGTLDDLQRQDTLESPKTMLNEADTQIHLSLLHLWSNLQWNAQGAIAWIFITLPDFLCKLLPLVSFSYCCLVQSFYHIQFGLHWSCSLPYILSRQI